MCNRHYEHNRLHGTPVATRRYTPAGTPAIRDDGYVRIRLNDGTRALEHVVIAERALGKPLPPEAEVHHVDENKANNAPTNLVVCPSAAYHKLLHQRMRAFKASGHYHWLKCRHCQQYDEPGNLVRLGKFSVHAHPECHRAYSRNAYQARKTNRQLENA